METIKKREAWNKGKLVGQNPFIFSAMASAKPSRALPEAGSRHRQN